MKETTKYEIPSQSISDSAKHFSFSISLNEWPAATAIISVSISAVLICGIDAYVYLHNPAPQTL